VTSAVPTTPNWVFWCGASGRTYRLAVYDLMSCPAPVRAGYIIAHQDKSGNLMQVQCGVACSTAPTLNLARIRRRAARLGGTQILVHDRPGSIGTLGLRRLVRDLSGGMVAARLNAAPSRHAAVVVSQPSSSP
jgi:hypothetical protein